MGKQKAILNQGEDRRKNSSCGKIEKPETPEDEKGKKVHLCALSKMENSLSTSLRSI
jgi:hypothetical protein